MGGRGAFYGGTAVLKKRDYKTLDQFGSVKLIAPNAKGASVNTPTLSHSKNAIYATLRKDGTPKQITVYGENRQKLFDIDLDHNHSKDPSYDVHVEYYNADGSRQKEYYHANREQRRLVSQLKHGLSRRKGK